MNFSDFLQRAELYSLQNFVRNGGETGLTNGDKSYSEMLDTAHQDLHTFMKERFSKEEAEEIYNHFDRLLSVTEDIYFEIGTIVGAKVALQVGKRIEELR